MLGLASQSPSQALTFDPSLGSALVSQLQLLPAALSAGLESGLGAYKHVDWCHIHFEQLFQWGDNRNEDHLIPLDKMGGSKACNFCP